MDVMLNNSMNIATVQQLFNEQFPFLKIEFFERENKFNSNIAVKKHITNTTKKLCDFKLPQTEDYPIIIHPEMTVTELEKAFTKIYKLQTQVFRKSGNIWLETTITDGWTLEDQNSQGQIITEQMRSR